MKTTCLVLLPVGPKTNINFLNDTLDSILYYIGSETKTCTILVIDDTRDDSLEYLDVDYKTVIRRRAKNYPGEENRSEAATGLLFGKLINALDHIVGSLEFDLLLKIDTDTLIIGESPHLDALDFFDLHPTVGMLGAFQRRGDGTNKRLAMRGKGLQLKREMSFPFCLRNLKLRNAIKMLVRQAQKSVGFELGNTVTGGGYFISGKAISDLKQSNKLTDELRFSVVSEDTLFALLVASEGYELSDPDLENDFMAINWRGLPMPLEELVAKKKKIVHPVKLDDPDAEEQIRNYFKQFRIVI